MMQHLIRSAAVFLIAVFLIMVSSAASLRAQDAKQAAGSGPNLRVVEVDDNVTRLDMRVKFFAPASSRGGPTVVLVSAIHVGDASFYEFAQKFLDSQDLVLFEGVGPGHMTAADSPESRIARTRERIRQVATMLERYKTLKSEYPANLAELIKVVGEHSKVKRDRLTRAAADIWKRPLAYERFAAGFTLASLGADGKPGGDGEDADLAYADQDPLTKEEIDDRGGLQNELAEALGLVFQLHAVDTGKANFRNADISLEKLQERMNAGGAGDQANELLGLLDGSSSMAGMVKNALALIKSNPRMQLTFKAVIMDVLAAAGDDISKIRNLPPALKDVMKVLIDERNQVVIDALKTELAKEKPAESIALWYGAGHMKDLEARLTDQLKYEHVGSFWLPAITLDFTGTGVKKSDTAALRNFAKAMIEAQK